MNKQRFIISQTNSGIQLLTMSETWNGKDISDAELEIPVYQLYRRESGAKGGGVVLYARNDL